MTPTAASAPARPGSSAAWTAVGAFVSCRSRLPARSYDAPPVQVLLEALHVRDLEGRWSLGGAAWIRIAEEVPLLRPLAVLARVPAIQGLVEWTYARVAGNRHRISHLLGDDACAVGAEGP